MLDRRPSQLTKIFNSGPWSAGAEGTKIGSMKPGFTRVADGRPPQLAVVRATEGRRRLARRRGGRAWINGREVGGADTRYSHLGRSYD